MKQMRGSERYCEYRGHRYVERASGTDPTTGEDYVFLICDATKRDTDFPDALAFETVSDNMLVKLPRSVISREWREIIHGLWHGVEFCLWLIPGEDQYYSASTLNPAAGSLGISGSQYDGWEGRIPANEVQLTEIETHEKPLGLRYKDITRNDVIVTTRQFTARSN